MAKKTRADLITQLNATIYNNASNAINGGLHNTFLNDLLDSIEYNGTGTPIATLKTNTDFIIFDNAVKGIDATAHNGLLKDILDSCNELTGGTYTIAQLKTQVDNLIIDNTTRDITAIPHNTLLLNVLNSVEIEPVYESSEIGTEGADIIRIVISDILDFVFSPDPSAFALSGTPANISSVTMYSLQNYFDLNLDQNATPLDIINVSYTQPGVNFLRNLVGEKVLPFGPELVTNNITALTAPSPLIAQTMADDRIYLIWFPSSIATEYILKRGVDTIYQGPNLYFDDTGLSMGIDYDYSVIATAPGKVDSSPATVTAKTVPFQADFFLQGWGIDIAADNDFADKDPGDSGKIDVIKSIGSSTGQDLVPDSGYSANKAEWSLGEGDYFDVYSKRGSYGIGATLRWNIPVPLVLTGAFTFAFWRYFPTIVDYEYWLDREDDILFIRKGNNNTTIAMFRPTTGSNAQMLWPEPLEINRWYKVVLQRNDSGEARCSNDGGVTWSSWYTFSIDSITVNKLQNAGKYYQNQLFVNGAVLEADDLKYFFDHPYTPPVTKVARPTSITPGGISTWSDLVDAAHNDSTLQWRATALTAVKKQVQTIGDYTLFKTHKNATLELEDSLYIWDHVNKKISDRKDFGVPRWTGLDTVHLHGGIEIMNGNVVHQEHDTHYDETIDSNWRHYKYPDSNFDFTRITEARQWAGYDGVKSGQSAYQRSNYLGNKNFMFCQGWGGGTVVTGSPVIMYESETLYTEYNKYMVHFEPNDVTYWIYNTLVSNANEDKLRLWMQFLDPGGNHYDYLCYAESEDGYIWYNKARTFSKDIRTLPITKAELLANYVIIDESAKATTYGPVVVCSHISPSGELYTLLSDGDGGLNAAFATDGNPFNIIPIDLSDKITSNWQGSGVGYPNQEGGYILQLDTNEYSVFTMEENAGNHKVIEFRTTDKFTTCSYFQDISEVPLRKHSNINGSEEPHHSGDNSLLVYTRQQVGQTGSVGADQGEAVGIHEITPLN